MCLLTVIYGLKTFSSNFKWIFAFEALVAWVLHLFWIGTPFQIYCLQIFCHVQYAAFSFCGCFPLPLKKLFSWIGVPLAYSSLSLLALGCGTEPENIAKTDVKECTGLCFLLEFHGFRPTLKFWFCFWGCFCRWYKKGFQVDYCACSCQFSQYCSLKRLILLPLYSLHLLFGHRWIYACVYLWLSIMTPWI